MSFTFHQGSIPLLVSFPHSGTRLPRSLTERMTKTGRSLPDTDWFLPRLYNFPDDFGGSRIVAGLSRYVVDLNRSPDGENLYPGQPTPGLCPTRCFDGSPIYLTGEEPDEFEIGRRTAEYWRPYHDRIHEELNRLKHRHGLAVLWDAHSIRSRVPRLFDGSLPDLNVGTARGASCDPALEADLQAVLKSQTAGTHVINGRFVGGYITRHYGRPRQNIHAVQLELSQARYLDESTGQWDADRVGEIRPVLRQLIETTVHWIERNA